MFGVWADVVIPRLFVACVYRCVVCTCTAACASPLLNIVSVNETFPSARAAHDGVKGFAFVLPPNASEFANDSADFKREWFARTAHHSAHPCSVRISWSEVALIPSDVSTSFSPCGTTP